MKGKTSEINKKIKFQEGKIQVFIFSKTSNYVYQKTKVLIQNKQNELD